MSTQSSSHATTVQKTVPFDPKWLRRYGRDGIPILTAAQIEAIATAVLEKYCPKLLVKPGQTPVLEIIKGLEATTNLHFSFTELGKLGNNKILGKVNFGKRELALDISLTQEREVQMRFTAAHEIGHWVLHRGNYRNWNFPAQKPDKDTLEDDEESLCRLEEKTSQDWLEWQANVFAAALTMPTATFQGSVIAAQRNLGITKNLGTVWIADNSTSKRDFGVIAGTLSLVFGVSKASIRVRLETLKLLRGESARKAQTMKEILAAGF